MSRINHNSFFRWGDEWGSFWGFQFTGLIEVTTSCIAHADIVRILIVSGAGEANAEPQRGGAGLIRTIKGEAGASLDQSAIPIRMVGLEVQSGVHTFGNARSTRIISSHGDEEIFSSPLAQGSLLFSLFGNTDEAFRTESRPNLIAGFRILGDVETGSHSQASMIYAGEGMDGVSSVAEAFQTLVRVSKGDATMFSDVVARAGLIVSHSSEAQGTLIGQALANIIADGSSKGKLFLEHSGAASLERGSGAEGYVAILGDASGRLLLSTKIKGLIMPSACAKANRIASATGEDVVFLSAKDATFLMWKFIPTFQNKEVGPLLWGVVTIDPLKWKKKSVQGNMKVKPYEPEGEMKWV